MKRVITILLAAALMLSMAACGGDSGNTDTPGGGAPSSTPTQKESTATLDVPEEPEIQELALGEMATTENVEFTLDNAQLTLAICNDWGADNYFEAVEVDSAASYKAPIGHTYIAITFTINNLDRVGFTYDGFYEADFMSVEYNGETYITETRYGMQCSNGGAWEQMIKGKTTYWLDVGEIKTIVCYLDIPVEVENFTDTFKFKVLLPKLAETAQFTYVINP